MTAPSAIIGGQRRVLNHVASGRRYSTALKPAVNLATLPMATSIASVPLDYDQGQLGSCGPNSLAEQYQAMLGGRWSRLFAYFFTRATEGDFLADDGVTIPDLLDVGHTMGLPSEDLWPYDVSQYQSPPPVSTLVAAVMHRVLVQDIVVDLDHLLFEIACGQPVILGFHVPASMQDESGDSLGPATATSGIVRVPSATDPSVGGHCVLACGYDRERQMVKTTCHYGSGYGDGGALWLPFAHWNGNVSDMRAVRTIGAA